MIKVGITERGDAGVDFSWVDKLLPINIIISKNLNDSLINALLDNQSKIIFHMTCTGYGSTILEPNVPNWAWTHNQVKRLIEAGFPVEQIVLRIDPIIPTKRGIERAEDTLEDFLDTGIKRVRYSFLDMYPHVKKRFEAEGLPLPYETFGPPSSSVLLAVEMLTRFEKYYHMESCAEYTKHQMGCISQLDFDILHIHNDNLAGGYQRRGCMCLAGKTELLNSKTRCPHQCLYCYWKD